MIENLLHSIANEYETFTFTGDSSQFRQFVRDDSEYLYKYVKSKTTKRSFIFVDEVQKCGEIFDAIKIAFDRGQISFIVSGSNPSYLATVAPKRLQRRADFLMMTPISLFELAESKGYIPKNPSPSIEQILWNSYEVKDIKFPLIHVTEDLIKLSQSYFVFGGLPLSILANSLEQKLIQIRLTVERGFELMSQDNNSLADIIRIELANLNSREFAYKNIFEKTRIKSRDAINKIIDQLINHGYLVKKKPLLLEGDRTSYLSVFSYIDPGIVSYLTGNYEWSSDHGFRVEGYVHQRLSTLLANSSFKSTLNYFKPLRLM